MAAITDALFEVARVARGYSWEQMLFTHPSGAVGRDPKDSLAAKKQAGELLPWPSETSSRASTP